MAILERPPYWILPVAGKNFVPEAPVRKSATLDSLSTIFRHDWPILRRYMTIMKKSNMAAGPRWPPRVLKDVSIVLTTPKKPVIPSFSSIAPFPRYLYSAKRHL